MDRRHHAEKALCEAMEKIIVGIIVGLTIGATINRHAPVGLLLLAIGLATVTLAGIATYLGHLRAAEDAVKGGSS